MAFERYNPQTRATRKYVKVEDVPPFLSIAKSLGMYVNPSAIHRFDLHASRYVDLFYDRSTQKIALRFLGEPTDTSSRKLTPTESAVGNVGFQFSASGFLNFYGIPVVETRKYNLTLSNGLVVADLKSPFVSTVQKPEPQTLKEVFEEEEYVAPKPQKKVVAPLPFPSVWEQTKGDF
jgi:hypothetical protein